MSWSCCLSWSGSCIGCRARPIGTGWCSRGALLAAFDERRPTRDVDLLARALTGDVDTIATLVRLAVSVDGGVVFDAAGLTAQVIREQDIYTGVRIVVPAQVDRARHPLRVDVNVGDPVTPAPVEVGFPATAGLLVGGSSSNVTAASRMPTPNAMSSAAGRISRPGPGREGRRDR